MELKLKHNKKRNTAILFEMLIRELTEASVGGEKEKISFIKNTIKEFFGNNTVLGQELKLYRVLCETSDLDKESALKLLERVKQQHLRCDFSKINLIQNELIQKISEKLGKKVFTNFVPNFKELATISQIFSEKTDIKSKILLENQVIGKLSLPVQNLEENKMEPMDKLTFKTYIKNFNEEYGDKLLPEQKELLQYTIFSFMDEGVGLKMFIREELDRLKGGVKKCRLLEGIRDDESMLERLNKVEEKLNKFQTNSINEEMVSDLMSIQELVFEASSND